MQTQTPLGLSIGDGYVVVSGLSPALAARFTQLIGPFVTAPDAAPEPIQIDVREAANDPHGTRWFVDLRGEELCGHARADDLLQYLEWLAISQALAVTQRYAVFHGAALANEKAGEGEAATVMLVGPSGAGKSTLTLNLVQRGWQPLSDDLTLMDTATGAIRPFPRCFHVDPAWAARTADHTGFEWPVGGIAGFARPTRWAAAGHRVTALYIVERDLKGRSACAPLTQAQGAGMLLTQSIMTALAPAEVARAAALLAGGARCFRLTNGDLEGALGLITACARDR